MTFKNITTILLGLMLCFFLLSKQTAQTSHIVFDGPSLQDVFAEEADIYDADIADEVILSPALGLLPILSIVLSIAFTLRYTQPIIPTPKRPPSL